MVTLILEDQEGVCGHTGARRSEVCVVTLVPGDLEGCGHTGARRWGGGVVSLVLGKTWRSPSVCMGEGQLQHF